MIELSMESRISQCAVVALLFCLNSAGSFAASEKSMENNNGFIPERPFSGVLVEYNRNYPDIISETRLLISEQGMLSETQKNRFGNIKIVFIKNYQTGQAWLADPRRRTYSALPKGNLIESRDNAIDVPLSQLGVLANRPCIGLHGSKQSTRPVGESELNVWRCTDELGRAYLQHFSTLLGVVVRQETQDGRISELRDIKLLDNSSNNFNPSNDFREVSLSEFIMGKIELPEYME